MLYEISSRFRPLLASCFLWGPCRRFLAVQRLLSYGLRQPWNKYSRYGHRSSQSGAARLRTSYAVTTCCTFVAYRALRASSVLSWNDSSSWQMFFGRCPSIYDIAFYWSSLQVFSILLPPIISARSVDLRSSLAQRLR